MAIDLNRFIGCGLRGTNVVGFPGYGIILEETTDNLIGPFWQPSTTAPIALMLKGPEERVYTI